MLKTSLIAISGGLLFAGAWVSSSSAQIYPDVTGKVLEYTLKKANGTTLGNVYAAGDVSTSSNWDDHGRHWTTVPTSDFSVEGGTNDVESTLSPSTSWTGLQGGDLASNSAPDDIEPDFIITTGGWYGDTGATVVGGMSVETNGSDDELHWYRTDYDSATAPATIVDSETTTLYFNINDSHIKIDAPWHRYNKTL